MKIIDFKKKGNVVRFYLGNDNLKDWYGDDWNDVSYEHNAGNVYSEFIKGTKDIVFPFDDLVLEPSDTYEAESGYCKNDMVDRRIPCIIVVPGKLATNSYHEDFGYWVGSDKIKKFYFGDKMEPDEK